jgi:hypothetical protein
LGLAEWQNGRSRRRRRTKPWLPKDTQIGEGPSTDVLREGFPSLRALHGNFACEWIAK